ncbi:MAG: MoeZ/MoeB [Lentisphaerae bacterium RIFOXYB12_FULL_65_16]|nr:MAG: MoeZ/MoeB [Lentisphaerae bacterium RIFOXYA12_64_32]OGV92128.1 MAG: MoeZ/MoeB [Lentisphaerae bacterium RIFOXYB12_FULL_65_16]
MKLAHLTDEERAVYEWQMWIVGFGEDGQRRLKSSSALVSRCGGLGGPVCYNLAAAGIGRLVVAHGGVVKPSDLNRQILMTHDGIGKSRIESVARRLRELNPRLDVVAVPENITEANVAGLVGQVDIVFDCAPLFPERFGMNRECVRQGKPMVEAAVFNLEAQVTTILPGKTPCLACLYPRTPEQWTRQFPVLGAVSALAGATAALEGIKVLTGLGTTLAGTLLHVDTATMEFRRIPIRRRPDCPVCGGLPT